MRRPIYWISSSLSRSRKSLLGRSLQVVGWFADARCSDGDSGATLWRLRWQGGLPGAPTVTTAGGVGLAG